MAKQNQVMELLHDLDIVNWGDFSHAYGTAEDVPQHIRAFLSQDESEWNEAYDFFCSSVWHQGTVYSVTAKTIPFLVRLLTMESIPHQDGILYLLYMLANGHSYFEVHYQLDPQWSNAYLAEQGTNYENQLRLERSYVENARNEVLKGSDIYVNLLSDDEPKIVGHAIYLLSDLRELPIHHIQLFKDIYEHHESEAIKNSALHGIRVVTTDMTFRKTFFESVFDSVDSPKLKSTAAIGAFETAGYQYRPDIFDYLLMFYEYLERETEWGWLARDEDYPDPWGPGITTSDITQACFTLSSPQKWIEVQNLAFVMQKPNKIFDLIKDVMFKFFVPETNGEVKWTSTWGDWTRLWREGTYVVDFYQLKQERMPLVYKTTDSPEKYRDVISLILDLDKFWEVESNMLNVFGLPHSRVELEKLYGSAFTP